MMVITVFGTIPQNTFTERKFVHNPQSLPTHDHPEKVWNVECTVVNNKSNG